MESSQKIQWQVGLFVSLGLIFMMVSIFMFGADKALFKDYAILYAQFDQVQGLNEGSIVSLSGVNIGNVKKIFFSDKDNHLTVRFRIERSYLNVLTQGSQVEIRTQGALGDKYVYIFPGPKSNPPLKDEDTLEVAKASDLIGVISERGKETEKIFDIINELYIMTKTMNANQRIDKLMNNFLETSQNLKETSAQTRILTQNLNQEGTQKQLKGSIEKMDSILTKIDKGQGTLGALINDSSLHNQLKSFLGGSQRKDHIKNVLRTSIEKADEAP